jgi:hypothetical protein
VTVRIELDLDTLAGGGAATVELDLDRGWGPLVEVEFDLDTEIGASRMVLGFADMLSAVEDAEADERTVAAELAREIGGAAIESPLLRREGILVIDADD